MNNDQSVSMKFYTVKDIQNLLGVSKTKAYDIIRKLNQDLEERGFIVVRGKIYKEYFNKRLPH